MKKKNQREFSLQRTDHSEQHKQKKYWLKNEKIGNTWRSCVVLRSHISEQKINIELDLRNGKMSK